MTVEDERFDPSHFTPPWVAFEHLERYKFAAAYAVNKIVVDCACGSGDGTRLYASAGATCVWAFDLSDSAIRSTAEKCRSLPNVEARAANALSLPLRDDSVDVFVSLETFEHLKDQRSFLAQVLRVLKPEGMLICSTPNRRVYSPGNTSDSKPWNRFHVREYSPCEFVDELSRSFAEIDLFGQNRVHRAIGWGAAIVAERFGLLPAVRLRQVFKLPRFITRRSAQHRVVPLAEGVVYEYMVAICRKPRPATADPR